MTTIPALTLMLKGKHVGEEGTNDSSFVIFNPLPPKGLMRCMTPLPQGPMAKMRVI